MIKVGERIPDIELEAFHKEETIRVRVADTKGKWLILLFYPADFTYICPTELEEAANIHEDFRKAGAEIMSVSTDTVFAHKAWHDHSPAVRKISYPMLSDPTGKLCRALGTYVENDGHSVRATFIIDPDGVVKAMEMHDNSIGRNIREIHRKLLAAKFVREHNGALVCPASWEPGKKALKPGMEMVGKI